MKRMWNRTFPGIGGRTYINSNGDRDTDFTLLDLSPDTGEFQAVAQYLGWKSKFEFIKGIQINWPNNAGPPANIPICGFIGERCISYSLPNYVIVAIILSAIILIVMLIGFFAYRHVRSETAIYSEWWRVKWEDVSFRTVSTVASFYSQKHQIRSKGDERSLSNTTQKAFLQTAGVYKGSKVHIKKLNVKSLTVDRSLLLELKKIQEITCQNLARLIGVCPETNNVCILTEYCSRGNLQDILQNESIQLDRAFKISLVNDIVEGMYYLHSSPINVHGRLTSSRCVIDSKFVLKITGFGLKSIIDNNLKGKQHNTDITILPELLWMAPEHLRLYPHRKYSQAGDLYSFGIILYEMITRNEPYVHESWYRSLEDTLERVKKGGLMPTRPFLEKDEDHEDLIKIAVHCWQENPHERPSFANVRRELKHLGLQKGKLGVQNVLDILLNRMEQYANNLEGLVEERTQQFLEEKRKSEELLHQVLPKSVAEQLLTGQPVHAEAFESVTVYFSDIVGFTNIAARSSPFQIVDFLNDLYTCFDSIIENFDVYKVETIGDAYMVVSGLPERNGNDHVRQVARMSLEILDSVRNFTIRHQPNTDLKARIGLHSGSVCAGVVGRKMPRYCLFGDTVNTASRMESTGEGMRIHISQDTKDLLDAVGGFISEERGSIDVKGKGLMTTHWLIEEILSPSVTSLTI